jgi:hypothetical protein
MALFATMRSSASNAGVELGSEQTRAHNLLEWMMDDLIDCTMMAATCYIYIAHWLSPMIVLIDLDNSQHKTYSSLSMKLHNGLVHTQSTTDPPLPSQKDSSILDTYLSSDG